MGPRVWARSLIRGPTESHGSDCGGDPFKDVFKRNRGLQQVSQLHMIVVPVQIYLFLTRSDAAALLPTLARWFPEKQQAISVAAIHPRLRTRQQVESVAATSLQMHTRDASTCLPQTETQEGSGVCLRNVASPGCDFCCILEIRWIPREALRNLPRMTIQGF